MEEFVISGHQRGRIALPISIGSVAQRNFLTSCWLWIDPDYCFQFRIGCGSDINRPPSTLCIEMVPKISASRLDPICPSCCLQPRNYNSRLHNCSTIYPADLRFKMAGRDARPPVCWISCVAESSNNLSSDYEFILAGIPHSSLCRTSQDGIFARRC